MKCPSCGHDNIAGIDRCEDCMKPLRDLDVPQPVEGLQAHIMLDPIRDIYSPEPATVGLNDSVGGAVEVMRARRAGCALVMDGSNLAGILTEVDLLFKLADPSSDLSTIPASQLMTAKPECVQEDSTIAYALNLMAVGGYRHLPVVRNTQVIGIVSVKDVLRYLKQHLL